MEAGLESDMGSVNCKNKSDMVHAVSHSFWMFLPCSDVVCLLLVLMMASEIGIYFGASQLDVKCSTST